ncbi:uracil-DNA glycosylase family protein [Pontixanthobacter gangjinensis]|uniref:Uracil-DNA glycosylase family protein n=1 Tax=Pontixanthobacter gangjinensis TaxID=1028742 RepID=A0A6I4SNS7_9SPHN|nr:uracil-DNA glycosylase family protein [Pontixanthobacter gangjinensis]MXO57374.1 uracil-DNA glycosylase family protein [Pontixanthobacter gangjinensis]
MACLGGNDRGVSALHREIASCTICAEFLADGPRPVVQFSSTAKLLIIGQAPGSRVHATGVPWDDDSGNRLREWMGLSKEQMYDPARVALVPMGFCYPGKASGGDKPPRKECAPQWHGQVLAQLPRDRLTLLVGTYAQGYYLPKTRSMSLTQRVESFEQFLPHILPLPHPAWRSRIWMQKNPWFEAAVLPVLRQYIDKLVK